MSNLKTISATWTYNWDVKPTFQDPKVSFVPMIWGKDSISKISSISTASNVENILLGFNEPDLVSQSNLDVDTAIALWPQLMKTNRKLGSPAVAWNYTWLDAFLSKAKRKNLRVDFLCIHYYSTPDSSPGFLQNLDKLNQKHGLPIWITEFSTQNGKNGEKFTEADTITFMDTVIPGLYSRHYIERFAWFSGKTTEKTLAIGALFNLDGSLTPVGKKYVSFKPENYSGLKTKAKKHKHKKHRHRKQK